MKAPLKELPELVVRDARAWRAWLDQHHATSSGVWLVLHKKGGQTTALTYDDALDEALCFGWIDGQLKTRDAESYRQSFTPRSPRSAWSARNVGHIERLEESGLMHEAGRRAVAAAKADGRWERAYASQSAITLPPEFHAALAKSARAQETFDALTAANRYAIAYRLHVVKKEETRARKITEIVAMLGREETFHPQTMAKPGARNAEKKGAKKYAR